MTTRFIYGGFQRSRRQENELGEGILAHVDSPNIGMSGPVRGQLQFVRIITGPLIPKPLGSACLIIQN